MFPLTYNIRDAMVEPYRMVEATAITLAGVAVWYYHGRWTVPAFSCGARSLA